MNSTKKLFFIVLIFVFSASVYSQDKPLSVTVNAGINFSDMRLKDVDTDGKIGFTGGLGLEYNLQNNLFIQTGLSFSSKKIVSAFNAAGDINGDGLIVDYMTYEGKMNMTYLSLPIKLGYRIPLNANTRLNLTFGPYLSYGLGGEFREKTAKSFMTPSGIPQAYYEESLYKTFSDNTLKRFDAGLSLGVGVEFRKILLNASYEYGLTNLSRTDQSSYNTAFCLTLGYRIF